MKKLTMQDLALFMGCQFESKYTDFEKPNGVLTMVPLTLSNYEHGDFEYLRPILRPLTDMNDSEAYKYSVITYEENSALGKSEGVYAGRCILSDQIYLIPYARFTVQQMRYLIERQFDVFGWIKAGLAASRITPDENKHR